MAAVPPRQASVVPALGVLALGVMLPLVLSGGFQVRIATLAWIYAILGMGFNLLYGFTGQISLGQQTFFAIGAYAFALLQLKAHLPVFAAFGGSIAICTLIALVVGPPLLRLRTHYLAMATLAFGLIFYGIAIRWIEFTGGSSGLAVTPLKLGDTALIGVPQYFVVLGFAVVVVLLHDFIIRSHIGRALQAIRDDELAASALGVNVTSYKLRIFVLAAVIAGVAGICFALTSLRVDPSLSEFRILVSILTIAVVGGLGTRFGPILGSAIVVTLPQLLVSFGDFETILYGAFILIFLLFMPHGLAGLIESKNWRHLFGGRRRSDTPFQST